MQYPQIIQPVRPQAQQITLVSPNGSELQAISTRIFVPGRVGVLIDDDAWVGTGVRISKDFIALDTVNGLAVFDLRAVQLLELIE